MWICLTLVMALCVRRISELSLISKVLLLRVPGDLPVMVIAWCGCIWALPSSCNNKSTGCNGKSFFCSNSGEATDFWKPNIAYMETSKVETPKDPRSCWTGWRNDPIHFFGKKSFFGIIHSFCRMYPLFCSFIDWSLKANSWWCAVSCNNQLHDFILGWLNQQVRAPQPLSRRQVIHFWENTIPMSFACILDIQLYQFDVEDSISIHNI